MEVAGLSKSSLNAAAVGGDGVLKVSAQDKSNTKDVGEVSAAVGEKLTLSGEALAKLAAEQQARNGGGTEPPDPPADEEDGNNITFRAMNGGGTEPPDPKEKPGT